MSRIARVWGLYPALLLLMLICCVAACLLRPGPWPIAALLLVLYIVPPLTLRVHNLFWPLRDGGTNLLEPTYAPWWGSHQIQLFYIACPWVESLLRLVPGAYSAWLRLWGSRIGRGVYWTPQVDILDRSLLHVEDGVVLGHRTTLLSHVITPVGDALKLYVKHIHLGSGAFLGAGCQLGPGATVLPGAMLPVCTQVFPNRTYPEHKAAA